MLRISHATSTAREAVLKIEGWINEADIALLETEITRVRSESSRLVLDLSGVRFIDRAALPHLRAWSKEHVILKNASPFIQALLEGHDLASGI